MPLTDPSERGLMLTGHSASRHRGGPAVVTRGGKRTMQRASRRRDRQAFDAVRRELRNTL